MSYNNGEEVLNMGAVALLPGVASALLYKAAETVFHGTYKVTKSRVGRLKRGWRRWDDLEIEVNHGVPPSEQRPGTLREIIRAGGFRWDLFMLPSGVWQKTISGKGIIFTARIWVNGPLCVNCGSQELEIERVGKIRKRDKYVCQFCRYAHPKVLNRKGFGKAGKTMTRLIKRALNM